MVIFIIFYMLSSEFLCENKCSWCGSKIVNATYMKIYIDGCQLYDIELCDIICAKLYNDNIRKINIDMTDMIEAYRRNLLSIELRKIYSKINGILFEMLPIFMKNDMMTNMEMKQKYKNIILRSRM